MDGATYLGRGTKSTDPVGELPKELKLAVKYFLLSTALRNCRGQRNKPNTMLIHIVRFVGQQNKVKQKVLKYFKEEIENHIRYGDPIIESELKSIWEISFFYSFSKRAAADLDLCSALLLMRYCISFLFFSESSGTD